MAKRKHMKGRLHSIEREYIINHTMPTNGGISGSAIFSVVNGKTLMVGIHTHHGSQGYNSGIRFNVETIQTLKSLQQDVEKMTGFETACGEINFQKREIEDAPDHYQDDETISNFR